MISSTVRTATETRLIALLAALEGFSDAPDDDDVWWVTQPVGGQRSNARMIVIGVPDDGALEPSGMRAGSSGVIDGWTIRCAAACTAIEDPTEAKQEVEDALNAVADLCDANHRLAMTGEPSVGCRDLMVTTFDGPFFSHEQGKPPVAWCSFDISAQADIERNRP